MIAENSAGDGANSHPAGRITTVNPCALCKSSPALLFCRKDTVFLCMACEAKLHGQTKHECVWMCEVCEQAPASVTCKADAAAMCATCDTDVHSANPLARRHVRIPVVPFYDSAEAVVNSTAGKFIDPVFGYGTKDSSDRTEIPKNVTNDSESVMKSVDLLSTDDRLFNFGFEFHDSVDDAVVPVQSTAPRKNSSVTPIVDHRSTGNRYEIDFNRCVINTYNKSNSQSHSISSSSMDAGVVIQENSLLDVSNPFMLPVNNQKTKQFSAIDREARVLRYREKRKKRKFEKKIRYASRKAYAEMRPRIKGRFAKRTEFVTVLDVERWWFTAESSANCYGECGVVPSF